MIKLQNKFEKMTKTPDASENSNENPSKKNQFPTFQTNSKEEETEKRDFSLEDKNRAKYRPDDDLPFKTLRTKIKADQESQESFSYKVENTSQKKVSYQTEANTTSNPNANNPLAKSQEQIPQNQNTPIFEEKSESEKTRTVSSNEMRSILEELQKQKANGSLEVSALLKKLPKQFQESQSSLDLLSKILPESNQSFPPNQAKTDRSTMPLSEKELRETINTEKKQVVTLDKLGISSKKAPEKPPEPNYPYEKQQSIPASSLPQKTSTPNFSDNRPTETISKDELNNFLIEQQKKDPQATLKIQPESQNSSFDPRPTIKHSENGQNQNPTPIPPLKPYLEISNPSFDPRPTVKTSELPPDSDYRPTETIPTDELHEFLKEQKRLQQAQPNSGLPYLEEIPANFKIYDYFISQEPIGSGADALIFEAFTDEERTHQIGVIKLAKKGRQNQLFKELEFAKRYTKGELFHENIVTYLKTGVTPLGLPFLLSEHLEPFPREKLTIEDGVCIIARIADLTSYLHKQRLYHRDIKPENILYSCANPKITPKLFDFGTISKQIKEKENAACSPYFAAPEVLRKIRGLHSDEIQFSKADVFSLGMTLLGLLNFNPYTTLEPNLEEKYPDARSLVDHLIFIHEKQTDALLQVIVNFIQDVKWETSFIFKFGIRLGLHQNLVDSIIPLLEKILHPKPEERPLCANFVKKLELLISSTFECSSEQFLNQGGSLFPAGPPRNQT